MDTSVNSNNMDNSTNTEIRTTSNVIKASMLAFGVFLSSNQMLTKPIYITSNTLLFSCVDGSFSTNGVYSNINKYNYAERYKSIAKSDWFQNAYKNKSLGEIVEIDV